MEEEEIERRDNKDGLHARIRRFAASNPWLFNLLSLFHFSLPLLQPHPCLSPSHPLLPFHLPTYNPTSILAIPLLASTADHFPFTSLPKTHRSSIFPTETLLVPCPLPLPPKTLHTHPYAYPPLPTTTHYALPLHPRSSRSSSLLVGRRRSCTRSKTRRTSSCQTSCCSRFLLFLRRYRLRWTHRRRGVRSGSQEV